MRYNHADILSTSVLSVLRSYAFFDNCRALAFALHPLKKSIATLESQTCTLADCYLNLARLGAAIKKLPRNNHQRFRQDCIKIFNRRFSEFDDDVYLLSFFLYPGISGKNQDFNLFNYYFVINYIN